MTRLIFGLVCLFLCCILVESTSTGIGPEDEHVSLEALCDNKPIKLVSISQVRRLISEAKSQPNTACDRYQRSLQALDDFLEVVESGKTCNLDLVDKIRHFQQEFFSGKKSSGKTAQIPDVISRFFISLCFQLSAECKINMINSLEYDTQEAISEADYEIIKLFERNKVTLLSEDTKVTDFDDLILLDDLSTREDNEQPQAPTKLLVKVKTNNLIKNLVKTCRLKFKPYYDKLIVPLIKLSNLGYNYQGELVARELEELKRNELVRRWYNIVQTCEALESLEIFEDPDMSLSGDRQAIAFISKTEAQELLRKQQIADDDPSEKPIEYEQAITHSSDRLWIQDQQELERLVSKYQAHVTEADRIRSKLLKKLLAQVKAAFKSGQIFSLASHTVKSAFARDSDEEARKQNDAIAAEDFIQMIDDAVESEESSTIVNEIDSAVAGPKYRRKDVPSRINFVPKKVNGSKFTNKLYDRTLGKIIPSKWNLVFWLMGIAGILAIVVVIVT